MEISLRLQAMIAHVKYGVLILGTYYQHYQDIKMQYSVSIFPDSLIGSLLQLDLSTIQLKYGQAQEINYMLSKIIKAK